MDNSRLVIAVCNLTCLGVLDCLGNVTGYGADLRVRHEASGSEDLTELSDNTHCIRGGDDDVEVHHAILDLCSKLLHSDELCAGCLGSLSVLTLGEYADAYLAAASVRKNDCSADILVRLLRVDSEVDRNVNAFNELGGGDVLDKIYSLISGVKLGSVNLVLAISSS